MNDVEIYMRESTLFVGLKCDIDHHSAKAIRERVDSDIHKFSPRVLVLDFSGVSFMDSSGIGLILGRVAVIQNIGARLKVSGLSASQMKIFRMAGIEKIKGVELVLK